MKRNNILLILILMICTGCSTEYNINITKNTIEEEIIVADYISSKRTNDDILSQYNTWYPTFVNYIKDGESIELKNYQQKVDGIQYHDKKINKITNGYKYTYKYIYDIEDYYDSYILASTFYETNINETNNKLILKTSKKNFLCNYEYFENVKVNITIDPQVYKLKYTNSQNKKNNTYTWNLNRNNCNDSEIILTLDKIDNNSSNTTNKPLEDNSINNNINNNQTSNTNNNKNNSIINNYAIYIFIGILVILLLFGYNWFNNMKEQNNNID